MRSIEKVRFPTMPPKLLNVAAYARVSSGKDAMLHSLSAQVSFYSDYIQKHAGWRYAGVYADEAKTGTKDTREHFQRMLNDCRSGKINMVITKSISRFARNTITLLETVRELKGLKVDVYFEEQNIHTLSADGELMMTILASYAQEESRSVSENQKWRIKRNFEAGVPWSGIIFGYRYHQGKYEVVLREADIVKRIFKDYLSGLGVEAIATNLNDEGSKTRCKKVWVKQSISKILKNYNYTGNLLLQKTFRENYLTKRTMINHGELPMYHAKDTHEAIIPLDTFQAVQAEMARRAEKHVKNSAPNLQYPFSGKIVCANCGKHYRRRTTSTRIFWVCSTFKTQGKAKCPSKQIPEDALYAITAEVLGSCNETLIYDKISEIRALKDNTLEFHLKDGSKIIKQWQDRSRADSWTDEMKAAAREKAIERKTQNVNS